MTEIYVVSANTSGGMFRSLKYYNAKLFFVGLLVSNIGIWLQLTGTSFLLYRLTGNATDLGINLALQFLPMLFLGAWAGALSDRHDRRTTTIVTQSLLAIQAITIGVLDLSGVINLPTVYVMSGLLGIVGAIDNPARRSLVTELVAPVDISNAMSLNTAVMTGSRIFGPALAAILVGPLGTGWLFIANGVSFAAMLFALFGLRRDEMHRSPPRPAGGTPVRDALRFVRHNERLFLLFIGFTIVSTFSFNYTVVLPKLADVSWGNPNAFGWVLAVTSIGSLVGSLFTARMNRVTNGWVELNILTLGVGNIALAWSPNIWVAYVAAVPLGFGGAAMIAGINSITQEVAPPDMRARLLALTAVAFLGSTPIGGPITGWIADHISASWALGYGGIIAVAASLYMLARLKRSVS
ncbi:MAG: MFS transporter [Ilumatobacteraceae bacterium]